MRFLLAALCPLITATVVFGAPCENEDFETRVSGESECLLMRRYGSIAPDAMTIWIHGNVTGGGPANAHFPIAEKAASDFAAENLLAVALVRPRYPDGTGESSSGLETNMAKHIGIAACSAEGAALCYRTLCKEALELMGEHMHPEVSMHTHPLGDCMVHIRSGNWPEVAKLMLSSVRKLAAVGARLAIGR